MHCKSFIPEDPVFFFFLTKHSVVQLCLLQKEIQQYRVKVFWVKVSSLIFNPVT